MVLNDESINIDESINSKYLSYKKDKTNDSNVEKIILKLSNENDEYLKINEQIDVYKEQLPYIIQQFRTSYYEYTSDKYNQEKINFYTNSLGILLNFNSKIDETQIYITTKLNEINELLYLLNKEIKIKKNDNKKLNDILLKLKNIQNGSVDMVYDYKNNYINLQIENIGLTLGIIFLTYLIIFGAFKETNPIQKFIDKYSQNIPELKEKLGALTEYLNKNYKENVSSIK